ncbi:MAG: acyl-CoA dehydrogenase [Robiginitomaculum sp.]|nr:MAG: acyl-CoA dehydrogenase [Robiginitomaculum sp.]
MIPRSLFSEEHELFRSAVQKFAEKEVHPNLARWEEQEDTGTDIWKKCGEYGFLCPTISEEYGGAGADKLYSMILLEELGPLGGLGLSMAMHSDIVARYIQTYGSSYLKSKYLPEMASGERIGALAMSEPGAGSDVKKVRTRAVKQGDNYVLNGSKIFITNGFHSGVVVVVAQTNKDLGAKGISLFLVDSDMDGFEKGKKLKKVGLRAQDTAELFFNDVIVPAENLLGVENQGFIHCMQDLPWERLQIGLMAISCAEYALNLTKNYVSERALFGKHVSDFQNTRFKMAELTSEVQIGRVFIDRCMELELKGELDGETASMAKYWCSDLQCKVADECVQLHGGYGFMQEYEIARAWTDARAQKIYGGTNEIMKDIIANSIFGRRK